MSNKLYLLLSLLTLVFFTFSCDNEENDTNNYKCDPICDDWEECFKNECKLKDDMCNIDTDCKTDKNRCNTETHNCYKENTEECTNGDKKCKGDNLLTCENNSWTTKDCKAENKECVSTNNSFECVTPINKEKTIPEVKVLIDSQDIITSGVITYIKKYENKVVGFYMQESQEKNGAIYVFLKNGVHSDLKIGDTVKVEGVANIHFGIVRIGNNEKTPTFEITDNTTSIPTPKDITTESFILGDVDMLVNMVDTPFTVIEMGTTPKWHTKLSDKNGKEFVINSNLYRFNEYGITVGTTISKLSGIAGSYQLKSDDEYIFLIKPRDANDITFDNTGTEGFACKDTDPKCVDGLICKNNICEIKIPCDNLCTELQYCNLETDLCVDLVKKNVSEVRNLPAGEIVYLEGIVSHYERDGRGKGRYYMQDNLANQSGILIAYRDVNKINPISVHKGDKLRVIGITDDNRGIIRIGEDNTPTPPKLKVLEHDLEVVEKSITANDIYEDNLFIMTKMQNPPFTVIEVERAHKRYVKLEDALGNKFLLDNGFIESQEFFIVGDVLTSLRGVVTFRFRGDQELTENHNARYCNGEENKRCYYLSPRSYIRGYHDFIFQSCNEEGEDATLCDENVLKICKPNPENTMLIWTEQQDCSATNLVCEEKSYRTECTN